MNICAHQLVLFHINQLPLIVYLKGFSISTAEPTRHIVQVIDREEQKDENQRVLKKLLLNGAKFSLNRWIFHVHLVFFEFS